MGKLKKVVIVGPLAPPAGGMANQTKKLSEFLLSEGLMVDIVRTNQDYKPAFVGKIPAVRALFRLITYTLALFKQLKNADVVHVMANSGWSWHLFAAPAILIGRLLGKPVVLNYRGGYAQSFFQSSWFWINLTLKRVQAIVVPSPFLQQIFNEFGKKAQVVPNVLDQNLFFVDSQQEKNESPHLIVTRNLEAIYDVTTAINAFSLVKKQYPKALLSVAGTGPELNMLKQQVASLNLDDSVTFTGRLCPENMAKLYQQACVMLNTSTVDNTPNSIIEALACGIPVVTTNAGGIPKLVTHNYDALLVEIGDDKKMASEIMTLLNDASLKNTLIKNGLNTIAKFYWSNVWLKLKACYDDVIEMND